MPSLSAPFATSSPSNSCAPVAELLEALALALNSVLPCVDRDSRGLDVSALEQIAARAVSTAEELRARCNRIEDNAAKVSFVPGSRSLRELERHHIAETLELCRWVIEGKHGAARLLGLHPNTLRHRLQKLELKRPSKK